jgi:RNA polymerase sigma factor (TIGR02999 family)
MERSSDPQAVPAHGRRLTTLLHRMADGDKAAGEEAFELLYAELHRIASCVARSGGREGTLQATDLIGQAYTRLMRPPAQGWKGRAHFLATAARAMRHVLIDHVRSRKSQRKGGRHRRSSESDLDRLAATYEEQTGDLLQFDRLLEELRLEHPLGARIVDLRFFAGLGVQETAEILDLSVRTIEREWTHARAWLKVRLS